MATVWLQLNKSKLYEIGRWPLYPSPPTRDVLTPRSVAKHDTETTNNTFLRRFETRPTGLARDLSDVFTQNSRIAELRPAAMKIPFPSSLSHHLVWVFRSTCVIYEINRAIFRDRLLIVNGFHLALALCWGTIFRSVPIGCYFYCWLCPLTKYFVNILHKRLWGRLDYHSGCDRRMCLILHYYAPYGLDIVRAEAFGSNAST